MNKRKIAILGSTGSIGTQALEVTESHSELYEVCALTARSHADLLIAQARKHKPKHVVIADERLYPQVRDALRDLPTHVSAGGQALCDVAACSEADIVLVALVGFAGLKPTLAALNAGKHIALANKETLVVAGELVTRLAKERGASIVPVDSEHSAIFQCLTGESTDAVEELILTASGGPFLTCDESQLANVKAEQALCHPNWQMGAKITIDSATMMNKGFEVIEAKWLFGIQPQSIRVVVHPQSIVHSAVVFRDGAVKAQLGMPDMRIPIQLALSHPQRLASTFPRIDWNQLSALTFSPPDTHRFPCLSLAYEALSRGGTAPCAMNAANEVANLAFRQGRCAYTHIARVIERTMQTAPSAPAPSLADYILCDQEARQRAEAMI